MSIESQQILKKDYIIIEYKHIVDEIEKMGVFALLYNGTTYVIQAVWKTYHNVPVLEYYESVIDPKVLVENIYNFETMMKRSIGLRKHGKYQPYPERVQPIAITNEMKDFTNNIRIQEVDQDLIDLEITIKANQYISMYPHEKLLEIITIMASF